MIALAKRRRQHWALDGAAIHKDELLRPRLPAHSRLPDQSADPDFRRIVLQLFDVEKAIDEILPVKIADAVEQTRGGRQLQDDALVAHKHERDLRMPRRLEMKLVLDVAALCVFRAQEFPARRQIVKNRAHFNLRAGSFAAIAHRFDPAARYDDFRACNRVRFTSGQPKARDAGDAGQRFAAKPKRGDRRQVGRRPDLARRMPLQGKERVVAVHPAAVVHHPHQRNPAAPDTDFDFARPGVDAVFDQLLDHRRRSLDHFARRHLTGEDFRQQANAAHLISILSCRFAIAKEKRADGDRPPRARGTGR